MDEFNFLFLALGLLVTLWCWTAVKKPGPERVYPFWYHLVRTICFLLILLPSILVSVLDEGESWISSFLYVEVAAFVVLLLLEGEKSRFGRVKKEASGEKRESRKMVMVWGGAVTILMWLAFFYMFR